jgi:hypothetical protein
VTEGWNAGAPLIYTGVAGAGSALAALLAPYADSTPGQLGRVVDVPPTVAATALQLLSGDKVVGRCNGVQPPMSWLQQRAAELGDRLVGSVWRGYVHFDGVQVPAGAARPLAERVATDWPQTPSAPAALPASVAEAWSSWDADEPCWTGAGPDLLTAALPARAAVVGLWWD